MSLTALTIGGLDKLFFRWIDYSVTIMYCRFQIEQNEQDISKLESELEKVQYEWNFLAYK